jgi:hypothetical protein
VAPRRRSPLSLAALLEPVEDVEEERHVQHRERGLSPAFPPMMPVPMEWRALAPAPTAIASGRQPIANASEVMMIGPQPLLAGENRSPP